MPYTAEHKQQSRERILGSAVRLFTRKGFDNTSIDEVMADADLTRGAFYAHFKSKQDLYAQAIASTPLFSIFGQPKPDDKDERQWLSQLVSAYLSKLHVKKADLPCPLAFLVTDVAVNEPEPRQAYTEVYLKMNQMIRAYTRQFSCCDKETVMAVTAMMIGGVAVSRTLTDKKAQDDLLKSCRQLALGLLGVESSKKRNPRIAWV
ncbi:MAG: TetR/AcrR family transcriptional regulator [Gammaproteobacteria bacterium]|nr:TetR/AcrR family transcriptional regulator [Gammaproteobacteria bacterium]